MLIGKCETFVNIICIFINFLLEYTKSLVNTKSFYANFTNTHFQKIPIPYLTRTMKPRIYKEGLTERAIILCKLNKSLLESSKSVGIHRQNSLYSLKNLCI